MTDRVFRVERQFGEGFFKSFWDENRIVTESIFAARRFRDPAGYFPRDRCYQFAIFRQRDDAAEPGRSFRRAFQFAQEFLHVAPIAPVFSGIAGRKDSRRALKRLHFKTGIVRDYNFIRKNFGDGDRFDHCVFFKGGAGLQDFRQIALARQIAERKIRTEQLRKFPRLVLVARCQEQIRRAQIRGHLLDFARDDNNLNLT